MIVLRNKIFSRHTPDNLEEYDDRKDLRKLSHGQRKDLITDEGNKADRNRRRYVSKKMKKYIPVGAIAGGVGGAALSKNVGGALIGASAGALGGMIGADIRGTNKAEEEGHVSRRSRQARVAKRIDEDLIKHKKTKEANYEHELRQDWKREDDEARQRAIEEERLRRERESHRIKVDADKRRDPNVRYNF